MKHKARILSCLHLSGACTVQRYYTEERGGWCDLVSLLASKSVLFHRLYFLICRWSAASSVFSRSPESNLGVGVADSGFGTGVLITLGQGRTTTELKAYKKPPWAYRCKHACNAYLRDFQCVDMKQCKLSALDCNKCKRMLYSG